MKAAYLAVRDPAEKERKRLAQIRVDLYYENSLYVLLWWSGRIFKDPNVRQRLEPFLALSAAPSLFKRMIDEVAGPVYQIPPTRKIIPAEGREPDKEQTRRYRELAKNMCMDKRLDLAVHLGQACNSVLLLHRYDERLGCLLDVLTPAQVTVLPDPADVHRELAVIYEYQRSTSTGPQTVYAYWDDEEFFEFNEHGIPVSQPQPNTIGRLPFVPAHMTERPCGQYWDVTTGNALEAASIAASLIVALTLKLHKSAGFKQPVVVGDIVGFPKEQVFDEENAILVPEGTRLETLDLTTPASHYLATLEDLSRRAAANYGVNLDRLNASASADASEPGLQERREDSIKIFRWVEEKCFEITQLLSKQKPDLALKDGTRLKVDFGELSLRTDPKGTLELWDAQISKGMRNELDNIRALNPEIDSDEEAWEEFERNLDIHSRAIEMMRALNMTKDATVGVPGQDASVNGTVGKMVQDGEMTLDEAAAVSEANSTEDTYEE